MTRRLAIALAPLAFVALACGGPGGTDATRTSSEPVPQTYAATSDGVCARLGLEDDADGLGPLVEVSSSHDVDRGTTDRCVMDDNPPVPTLDDAGQLDEPEAVTVLVEVRVRTDGAAPPLDPRQFPLHRPDGVDVASESIHGWWDDGVTGTQTLVADDGTVHGHAASGAVRHDNLKVLVEVSAEHSADPGPYRAAVARAVDRLLADVGPRLAGQ